MRGGPPAWGRGRRMTRADQAVDGLAWADALAWAAAALWAVAFLCRLVSDSLRNYSLAVLDKHCKDRDLEDRFGEILEGDEPAELMADTASRCLAAAAAGASAVWLIRVGVLSTALGWAVVVVGGTLAIFLAMVVLPWAISHVAGDRVVIRVWPLLAVARKAFAPLERAAEGVMTVIQRLSGREEAEAEKAITGEMEAVVDEGARGGQIEREMSQMIRRVVDLTGTDAKEIMTPRTDFNSLPVDTPVEEARKAFLEFGHSRIPVTGESPDDILGVVYAKDLLHLVEEAHRVEEADGAEEADGVQKVDGVQEADGAGRAGEPRPPDNSLRPLLRETFFVPGTKQLDKLLQDMKTERTHLAIVLDEYGGVIGLVTLEDILEEIVGDIADEYDPESEDVRYRRIDERTVEIEARTRIDELNRELNLGLPDVDDFETIGGFVFGRLDHVPVAGEAVEWENLTITVIEATPRKIVKVHVRTQDDAAV